VTPRSSDSYQQVAEAAWRWVLEQVRGDDGPWIPESVSADEEAQIPPDRDGSHSGIGGLAYVLAEIRLTRPWSALESSLADGIAERLRRGIPDERDCTFFDGLPSTVGALTALGAPGVETALDRLAELATPDGWPQTVLGPPRYLPETKINDLTLGTAGVLLAAVWAHRHGSTGARMVADHAAEVLLAEAEPLPAGTNWLMASQRFRPTPAPQMPNFSHGLAGIASALACAGAELGRPDLVEAARSGAEHLVTMGDSSGHGFVLPLHRPPLPDFEDVTFSWCHGPTGTSYVFLALQQAGVEEIAGESTVSWHRRCLHSVRTSGIPARLRPGFWDNDGRCCGTAGVGEVFLDSWQRCADETDLEFAVQLADTILDHAVEEGPHAYWRFIEHRISEPLLPPGVGWMQGAAGIAAFLFRLSRLLRQGPHASPVARMDNWWAFPTGSAPRI
jgi:lantibiotic modifying enzyme